MKLRAPMPELSGATAWLNGKKSRWDLVGEKPALIHFWSNSCALCKEAMPGVNYFRDLYKADLNVVAVHMPRSKDDKDLDKIRKAAARHDITQPVFIDSDLTLTNAFGNQYIPAYYVFDKDGNLRHTQAGGGGMRMLEKRINRVIDEMKAE